MRRHPLLLEINARLWLRRLTSRFGRPLTLGTLPDHLVKEAVAGFDTVWMMGVWTRTAGSRQQALSSPGLIAEFDRTLPGWTPSDVAGSPYAVGAYALDPALGPPHALADLAGQLGAMGRSLIVDFVPNHLAVDHPWTLTHPHRFITGRDEDVERQPDVFFRTPAGAVLAHGKDPHFAAWGDTVQVNVFHPEMREAMIDQLLGIASVADGVRCDMAMLLLNDVFTRTWGWALRDFPNPASEFWSEAIARVKQRHPNFVFIAEAYWGMEGRLVELGFDYTYDKTLYDRLLHGDAESLRVHLQGQGKFLRHGVRFVENHDEPRSMATLGPERYRAAALAATTLPGMRLLFDGQSEGRRVRVPVQLIREPQETPDEGVGDFYRRLVELSGSPALQRGQWSFLPIERPARDDHHLALVAWAWWLHGVPTFIVINQSDGDARGVLRVQIGQDMPARVHFHDPFGLERFEVTGESLLARGLEVHVRARQARVFCGTAPAR